MEDLRVRDGVAVRGLASGVRAEGKGGGGRDSLPELAVVVSRIRFARGRRTAEKAREKQRRRG